MKKILVTGASSFVGQALCSSLLMQGYVIRAAVRSSDSMEPFGGLDVVVVGEVGAQTDWSAALQGVDCVIHCAARAHVMHEKEADALVAYRAVNVAGTQRLAEQASLLGVRRLVYLSSIKVNGEQTAPGSPFLFSDAPAPEDPYGLSKFEAEQALWAVSAQTGLQVVVVRPPLVYGPWVKGNLLRLLRLVAFGVPLPFGALRNQRSLVGLSNLVDLLLLCAECPAAANQTFLVSDGEDLSTTDLLRRLGKALHKSSCLLPVPSSVLEVGAQLVGKRAVAQRLLGNLQVDISRTREVLDWSPPVSVDEELKKTANWFLS